ncbi:MAG TPA: CoxE, partial [Solirubrobacteraceae bacterium]
MPGPADKPDARRAALFASTPAGQRPPGMAAALLEFGEELRGEGVTIGTSELLDAFGVLEHVDWTQREDFRSALSATLAKSPDDRKVFDLVFDRFFFRAAEMAAVEQGVQEQGGVDLEGAEELDLEMLRQLIAEAIRDGDEGRMADLARLAIAAFGRQGDGSGVIGVDVQRIRRQLGLRAEAQPDLPQDDPRREGLPRDELRRFEQALRRELERQQIERQEQL